MLMLAAPHVACQSSLPSVTITFEAASGADACDPCVPTLSSYGTTTDPARTFRWVTAVFDTCVGLPNWGVMFFGLPSGAPLPMPGVCGDVLLSPQLIAVHRDPEQAPFGNFLFKLDITNAPRGASLWLQVVLWNTWQYRIQSVSDRYRMDTF
jgi:hypothetical protein